MRPTRRVVLPAAVVACLLAVLLAPAPAAAAPADTSAGVDASAGADTPATLSAVDQSGPLAEVVAQCELSATDIAPGESVTLDSSASQDADVYRYDKFGSGEFGDFVESATRTFTYQEVGTYEPQVRAVNATTDATDQVACGTLTVAENQPPTVDFAYSPTEPAPEEAVSFSADAADPDGEVVEYIWRVDGEPVAEGPSFEYAFPGPGEYTVGLTVTDDDGAQTTAEQVVSVSESNQAPTVDFAYSPTEPAPEEGVSFSADAADPDGEVVEYIWRVDGEPVADQPSFEYAFPGPGEYTVELAVTDDDGATDTATRTVTVTDDATGDDGVVASSTFDTDDDGWRITGDAQGDGTAPDYFDTGGNPGGHICANDNVAGGTWYFSAPAKFLGDRTGAYGGTLAFDIKQSSTDDQFAQDDIVLRNGTRTIVYDFGNATAHPGTDWTAYSVPLDATDPGWTYDSGGDVSPAAFRTLLGNLTGLSIRGEYVSGSDTGCLDNVELSSTATENQPPTADFVFDPSTPAPEETTAFEATASDGDGEVVAYRWTVDGEPAAEGPAFEYAFPGPGEYTVELTVTDDDGATDSVTKTVTVAEGNQAPTVGFDLSPATPAPGEDVALVAEATDPDGEVVAYRWTVDDRTVAERPELTYTFEDPGTYVVAVTVTDDDGATASASREVTVEGEEQSPTATPTPTDTPTPTSTPAGDVTLSAAWWHSPTVPLRGEPVTLVASGPADSAVTYQWDVDDDGSYEMQGALASHVFTTAGDHTVTLQATLPDGSTETTTETVAVADETVSQRGTTDLLWHAPVNPRPDETVTLVASVPADGDVAGYRWDLDGDGQPDATGEVVTHTYPTEGRYAVDLTVEYSNGSTAAGADTVVVGDPPAATATATATRTAAATRTTTDGGTPSDTPAEGTTGGTSPGFGVLAGLVAFVLLAARLVGARSR
jgi:PKD repeat protein